MLELVLEQEAPALAPADEVDVLAESMAILTCNPKIYIRDGHPCNWRLTWCTVIGHLCRIIEWVRLRQDIDNFFDNTHQFVIDISVTRYCNTRDFCLFRRTIPSCVCYRGTLNRRFGNTLSTGTALSETTEN